MELCGGWGRACEVSIEIIGDAMLWNMVFYFVTWILEKVSQWDSKDSQQSTNHKVLCLWNDFCLVSQPAHDPNHLSSHAHSFPSSKLSKGNFSSFFSSQNDLNSINQKEGKERSLSEDEIEKREDDCGIQEIIEIFGRRRSLLILMRFPLFPSSLDCFSRVWRPLIISFLLFTILALRALRGVVFVVSYTSRVVLFLRKRKPGEWRNKCGLSNPLIRC